MTAIELKTILIHKISEINDISFLQAIKTILDSKTETGVLKLSSEQLNEIIASKKEIKKVCLLITMNSIRILQNGLMQDSLWKSLE